ncbi:Mitochondria-eating protein [Lonchura striata]|uniref:Mitochondria-eating protein n=1 Tax=Lonchura striata TaxID=40157 RepID=A0A218VG25_9PASE|nr:Mitochondria-eating protein [Lonchura striata domestica]
MAKDLKSLVGGGSAREMHEKLESWQQNYEDSTEGELQLRDLACKPKCELQDLEDKLNETRVQINQMERDLKASRAEQCSLRRLQQLDNYEQKIEKLRDEIAMLDCKKSFIQSRPCVSPCRLRPCSPPPCRLRPCVRPPKCRALCVRPCSPPRLRRGSASHRACLIARYNFIYAKERLEAEATLKQYFCDLETIHRILYIAAVVRKKYYFLIYRLEESFRSAKMAFWKVRINVKDTLAVCHRGGPSSLEIAVLDYIACHKDLYDVCCSVHEVVCTMNKNPKFLCPGQVDFIVISPLIRELCCLAFSMQTLIPPLDVAFGIDGECFNRNMYYRSFDSDFTAPFVAYHVWPPLIEDGTVIVKGEVVTKKFTVPRSRSLSTVRVKISTSKCSSHIAKVVEGETYLG